MGRRSVDEINYIKETIKKIMLNDGLTSPSMIEKVLKERYGLSVAKQTLLKMCDEVKITNSAPNVEIEKQVDSDTETVGEENQLEYETHPDIMKINRRIAVLESDFKKAVSVNERCKLSGQLDSAQKSKLDMKKTLREADLLKRSSNISKYVVKFGEPTVIKKDNDKQPFFKTDEKQKALPIKKDEGDAK